MKKLVCILLAVLMLCGCAPEAGPAPTAQTVPPTQNTAPETIPPATTVPETEPPFVWDDNIHSGLRPDGSFGEGTLFLGDSLTVGLICQYLIPEGLLGDARFAAKVGMPLQGFSGTTFQMESGGSCAYSPEFHLRSCAEAAAIAGGSVTALYFMLGTNFDYDNNADAYIQVTEYLLEVCPNATIYLQLIPYSEGALVYEDQVNESIRTAHRHFAEAGIQRVMLLDTYTAIGENLNPDGIHLNAEGQQRWYEALVRFAEENQIPE